MVGELPVNEGVFIDRRLRVIVGVRKHGRWVCVTAANLPAGLGWVDSVSG